VIAITSPGPGDGKSITAVNLAGALAQSHDARVLIIDADLRGPSVAEYLGLGRVVSPGLAEAIADDALELTGVVRFLHGFNLAVVPAGAPQASPYELLNSARLERLLADARRQYDFVLVDTPPLLPFPDSRVLSRLVDGFLVVVAAHRTPRRLVNDALSLLDKSKVSGVVFNGDDQPASSAYGYSEYYSTQPRDRQRLWGRGF
jgi:capsular exopolysaccharide synthesis family protein